ncbi:LysM peptidoglycan-binding domain-containing protein [Frigoribacterium sp. VKM Ac-2836]|uniref:muramidase family protein n=1 Tax=Frigoribacterium sp. VKM Ac-2836 TaxID=2739014 RepID=UPI001563A43A|nr:LysM peptidoglycan-binding domain-containing protein [Frigoribacterium sp. VKM Ac-2836]NRD26139.1 LysM peptidoglycan-binding domain-containing protein [Frigoribacterium sp. VKM Ac-2836]
MNDVSSARPDSESATTPDGRSTSAFGPIGGLEERKPLSRMARSMLNTVPIVVAGSMALSMGVTGPVFALDQGPTKKPDASPRPVLPPRLSAPEQKTASTVETASSSATVFGAAPATYTVRSGDTVASIAGSFGLSTASVLALNGLSWKSTIFPGQTLSLSAATSAASKASSAPTPTKATGGRYVIVRGDTLSSIARAHGVTTSALIQANGLGLSSIIYPGQSLSIPSGAPAAATPAPTAGPAVGSYVIQRGDTIASIATKSGTSVKALLAANGLSFTSTIYAGKTLTLPGASAPTATTVVASTTATPIGVSATLTAEQAANARTIISVGRQLGVGDRAIVIALAAAAQESSLRNLDHGDRDSLGLFQQRPSTGWGTPAQLRDPAHATKLFFGGATNPNTGKTRGLLDVKGWQSMTLTKAAQAVQYSAFPDAYAKWEAPATTWLATLG